MKRILLTWILAMLCIHLCSSQGIRISEDQLPPDESAILDIQSTDKGVLIPRTQHENIINPADGLLVYDIETHSFWFYNGTAWVELTVEDSPWTPSGEDIFFNNNGNVGIGTDDPQYKLDIQNVEEGKGLSIKGDAPGIHFGTKEAAIGYATSLDDYSPDATIGDLIVRADTGEDIIFTDGEGKANLFIDGDRNSVAIGTTETTFGNPDNNNYRLTVQGPYPQMDIQSEDDDTRHLQMGYDPNLQAAIFTAFKEDSLGIEFEPIVFLGSRFGIHTFSQPEAILHINALNENIGLLLEKGKFSMGPIGVFEIDEAGVSGNKRFVVNEAGRVGIGRNPVTNRLEVAEDASKSQAGEWAGNSDARLKKNILPLNSQEILSKMLQMRGVQYEWKTNEDGTKRKEGIQYGFIAQDIQKVFPELVSTDNNGYLQTAYGTYDPMYVEIIKALNKKIGLLEESNSNLMKQVEKLDLLLNEVDKQQQMIEQLESQFEKN